MAGLRRYANKRDASEPEIVAALQDMGCSVERMDKPVDLLVGYRGVTHLVECKTAGTQYAKDLNENQKRFTEGWRGSRVVILTSQDDAISFIKNISREAA